MTTLREHIQAIEKEWTSHITEASIRQNVHGLLEQAIDNTIMRAAGLVKDSYGNWYLQHYGNTSTWVEDVARDEIRKYLDTYIKATLPELTDTIKQVVQDTYKKRVIEKLQDFIEQHAEKTVEDFAYDLIEYTVENIDVANLAINVPTGNNDESTTNLWEE